MKKPTYKRWWSILLVVLMVISGIGCQEKKEVKNPEEPVAQITLISKEVMEKDVAKLKAEEQVKKKEQEEAKEKAELEQKKKEDEAKIKAEQEKKKKDDEAKIKAEIEQKKKDDELKKKAEEEENKKAEEEENRIAAEEADRKAAEEEAVRVEEEANRVAEEEARIAAETVPEPLPLISTNQGLQYIGNVNSKKFHSPGCHTLPNEENRVYFNSRDEAINAGYVGCKNCNP